MKQVRRDPIQWAPATEGQSRYRLQNRQRRRDVKRSHDASLLSIVEIDALIDEYKARARALPVGKELDCVLDTVLQLRMCAEAKRWIASTGVRRRA